MRHVRRTESERAHRAALQDALLRERVPPRGRTGHGTACVTQGQSEKSEENGCYVALLEYNGRNGMMPINEYTTTMRKAIHRAMKVGKK